MEEHNGVIHNGVVHNVKPYKCKECKKDFKYKSSLRIHERIHYTGEICYQCEYCEVLFICEQDFRNHMLIPNDPSEERDNCNTCLDGFDNQYDMYKHLHYNHLCERPYKCDACLATFVYPNHLKFHLHIHTKLEPYFCEICGEVFKTKISKNKHTMCKHDFIKPYECTICHKSYMRQSKLFKHMRKQGHRSLTLIEKTLEVLIE